MKYIIIDDEMRAAAKTETERRDPNINHHFTTSYADNKESDLVGFLGEFACCKLFGKDWKLNIRDNYLTIDSFDIAHRGKQIDVKTETVPDFCAERVLKGTVNDDRAYDRRLINANQFPLLHKYHFVIFGMFVRGKLDKWYPLGYVDTATVLKEYPPQTHSPFGVKYDSPASAVRNSVLKPVKDLL